MDAETLRKAAQAESGRQFFEDYGEVSFGHISTLRMEKAAHADRELLHIASWCADDDDILEVYEVLGGDYEKQAFGQPMFAPPAPVASPTATPGAVQKQPGTPAGMKPPAQGAGGAPTSAGLQTPKAPAMPATPQMGGK